MASKASAVWTGSLKEGKGTYRVHPAFAWKGELASRETKLTAAPKLRLLEPHA